ncbi:hypothetical protein B0I37DRAFT_429669 [Chaetomium sp. MPI-CAGE-AT-0009]|nr:hypothetical protein B0I37DRAFT_429669 [Chaetomium sp. MPI-CAGE-AT-0009]
MTSNFRRSSWTRFTLGSPRDPIANPNGEGEPLVLLSGFLPRPLKMSVDSSSSAPSVPSLTEDADSLPSISPAPTPTLVGSESSSTPYTNSYPSSPSSNQPSSRSASAPPTPLPAPTEHQWMHNIAATTNSGVSNNNTNHGSRHACAAEQAAYRRRRTAAWARFGCPAPDLLDAGVWGFGAVVGERVREGEESVGGGGWLEEETVSERGYAGDVDTDEREGEDSDSVGGGERSEEDGGEGGCRLDGSEWEDSASEDGSGPWGEDGSDGETGGSGGGDGGCWLGGSHWEEDSPSEDGASEGESGQWGEVDSAEGSCGSSDSHEGIASDDHWDFSEADSGYVPGDD